jgi:transcriptional regulator with XRE-family HTH domain
MNIGETIKKLRRQKDMTQEQLAEYLSISPQAVSRWEINSTLPDITLVPMLANIFDVTADMLLGVDIEAKEKRINDISAEAGEYSDKGYREKAVEILRGGLKEYPNSYRLMLEIMQNLWTGTAEKTEKDKKEIIYFGEKILAECNDDFFRNSAVYWLCPVYSDIGEREKAEKLAEKMPFSQWSADALLTAIYTGDKKHRLIRQNIYGGLLNLHDNIKFIVHYPLDNGINPYTVKERIILHKKFIEILNIIFDGGNFGGFNHTLKELYRDTAVYSMQAGNYEEALENLKTAAEYAVKCDEKHNPEQEYTSLFLKGMKFDDIRHLPGSPNNTAKDFLEFLQAGGSFEQLRGNADFIEIEENLKKYAKNN